MFSQAVAGDADRFVALMSSQGSYQALKRLDLSDEEIGVTQFRHEVDLAFRDPASLTGLRFSWRVRLGVKAQDVR
jgi:hypothetical protein